MIESEYPILIERYGYVPDTGGPGKVRGSLAITRQYRFLEKTGTLQLRTDRRRFLPYGLAGGRPGTPSDNVLNPDTDARQLPSKCTLEVRRGDVFRHLLAGAGGWGNPLERDPELVLKDVLEEKLTPEYARREYGVAIDVEARRSCPGSRPSSARRWGSEGSLRGHPHADGRRSVNRPGPPEPDAVAP